ncbi:hypothetical protein SEA_ODAY_46 [Gordonia phage ODay]|nr:hypothetical protein SEA_ODAY_46 [Gordonia phage ODay]
MLTAHCPSCQEPLTLRPGKYSDTPTDLGKYTCGTEGCEYRHTPGRFLTANPDAAPHFRDQVED